MPRLKASKKNGYLTAKCPDCDTYFLTDSKLKLSFEYEIHLQEEHGKIEK